MRKSIFIALFACSLSMFASPPGYAAEKKENKYKQTEKYQGPVIYAITARSCDNAVAEATISPAEAVTVMSVFAVTKTPTIEVKAIAMVEPDGGCYQRVNKTISINITVFEPAYNISMLHIDPGLKFNTFI